MNDSTTSQPHHPSEIPLDTALSHLSYLTLHSQRKLIDPDKQHNGSQHPLHPQILPEHPESQPHALKNPRPPAPAKLHHAALHLLHRRLHDHLSDFLGRQRSRAFHRLHRFPVPRRLRDDGSGTEYRESEYHDYVPAVLAMVFDSDWGRDLGFYLDGAYAETGL